MTGETPSGEEETATAEISGLQGKCIRQNVLIVVLKPKYLLNLIRTDRFTAENVFLNTGNPDRTDTKNYFLTEFTPTLISFPLF